MAGQSPVAALAVNARPESTGSAPAPLRAIASLDATHHSRHALHSDDRIWVEKNCYVDVWIEVLNALRLEPAAVMPFAAAIDFDVGQWTFFKPSHEELRDLYGIDVQELNVWRPLLEHAQELLAEGRLLATEADSYWLADTSGTDYRRQHTKTTIVIAELDVTGQRLGYFHNAGYYMLEGEDFRNLFELQADEARRKLPLFAESIRCDQLIRRSYADLVSCSLRLWRRHCDRMPATNPVERFAARFQRELSGLQDKGLPYYHSWAFGTTRQLGSACELVAENLRWMQRHGAGDFGMAIDAYQGIASACKTFILKAARSVSARRPFDGGEMFDRMARNWDLGRAEVCRLTGSASAI